MKPFVPLLAASLLATASCNDDITGLEPPSDPATETFAPSLGIDIAAMTRTPEGVYYIDEVVGTGTDSIEATTDSARVTYALYLKDGTLVESNTANFVPSGVIAGFRAGFQGMKVGGKRTIVIPSELGYGRVTQYKLEDGEKRVKIPRQSTLIFDLEIRSIWNRPPTPPPAS